MCLHLKFFKISQRLEFSESGIFHNIFSIACVNMRVTHLRVQQHKKKGKFSLDPWRKCYDASFNIAVKFPWNYIVSITASNLIRFLLFFFQLYSLDGLFKRTLTNSQHLFFITIFLLNEEIYYQISNSYHVICLLKCLLELCKLVCGLNFVGEFVVEKL